MCVFFHNWFNCRVVLTLDVIPYTFLTFIQLYLSIIIHRLLLTAAYIQTYIQEKTTYDDNKNIALTSKIVISENNARKYSVK